MFVSHEKKEKKRRQLTLKSVLADDIGVKMVQARRRHSVCCVQGRRAWLGIGYTSLLSVDGVQGSTYQRLTNLYVRAAFRAVAVYTVRKFRQTGSTASPVMKAAWTFGNLAEPDLQMLCRHPPTWKRGRTVMKSVKTWMLQ
jgi:hypothetical protein